MQPSSFLAAVVLLGSVRGAINEFYPLFLNVESCTDKHSWTMWFNVGKPTSETSGDVEEMETILARYPTAMCRVPFGGQARSINYRTGNWSTGWQRKQVNLTLSYLSFYSFEPVDVDFQVRYCCLTDSFIPATTTRTFSSLLRTSFVADACGKQHVLPKTRRAKRLYKAEDVIPYSWPWVIYYLGAIDNGSESTSIICTATLISRDHVLTAAHCVARSQVSDILLIAGSYDPLSISKLPKNFRKQQWRTVQQVYIHPQFDSLNLNNDIAILQVNASFIFNEYVQPICLPMVDAELRDEVIMVGWGAAIYGGRPSKTLKQAYTRVVGSCDTYWPVVDDRQQICVANAVSGSSTCSGDSGGPLLSQYQERYVVLGISSFSGDCNTQGNETLPNIYTRVTAYRSWIQTTTAGASDSLT